MSATMTKGPAPNYSDESVKQTIVGIVKTFPHITPKALRGELREKIGHIRLRKLIGQVAKWDGSKWDCTIKLRLKSANPFPAIVNAVKSDLAGGAKPLEIAAKRGLEYSMVMGISRGRYDGVSHCKFVKVNGMLKLYDEKGYERSGKSLKGALEVSNDNNMVRCHECGDWFENLAAHVRYEHDIKARDYKASHSLSLGTALVGDAVRLQMVVKAMKQAKTGCKNMQAARAKKAAMIAAGTGGNIVPKGLTRGGVANLKGNCAVQLTNDLKVLADRLGRCPTVKETEGAGICYGAVRHRFGTIQKALATVGVKVVAHENGGAPSWYTKDQLIEMLKAFQQRHKRQPCQSDLRRGLLPSGCTFVNHFGSLNNALVKAGMQANARGWGGMRKSKRAKIIAAKTGGAPVPTYRREALRNT
jgi:hypothetical protein